MDIGKSVLDLFSKVSDKVSDYMEKSCPNCRKSWVKAEASREIVAQLPGYKTVTRNSETKDKHGNVVSTSSWQEQVHIIKIEYRHHYNCKECGHHWTGTSVTEKEG